MTWLLSFRSSQCPAERYMGKKNLKRSNLIFPTKDTNEVIFTLKFKSTIDPSLSTLFPVLVLPSANSSFRDFTVELGTFKCHSWHQARPLSQRVGGWAAYQRELTGVSLPFLEFLEHTLLPEYWNFPVLAPLLHRHAGSLGTPHWRNRICSCLSLALSRPASPSAPDTGLAHGPGCVPFILCGESSFRPFFL